VIIHNSLLMGFGCFLFVYKDITPGSRLFWQQICGHARWQSSSVTKTFVLHFPLKIIPMFLRKRSLEID